MSISRRRFFKSSLALSLGFAGLYRHLAWGAPVAASRFGSLVADPEGVLDLPEGFSYRLLSQAGDMMDDGLLVPGKADGMAAFPGPEGRSILVRNHELGPDSPSAGAFGENNKWLDKIPQEDFYDFGKGKAPNLGGTTTAVYNHQTGTIEREFLSLAGTANNCAGGPTPWNSWITCEETTSATEDLWERDHGYNFEVPATAGIHRAAPVPLVAMGRFKHEAVAVDPKTGIVYETEDTDDSLIYRFVPDEPGKLTAGGKLQALAVIDQPQLDTRNWKEVLVRPGEPMAVRWVDIENVESPENDLRYQGYENKGCAIFARGEGMWYGHDSIYFTCTSGGPHQHCQIFRYRPSPDEGTAAEDKYPATLELFVEPDDAALIDRADNITVTPFGDLIVCEDGGNGNNLVGIKPSGEIYRFAHNAMNSSEFAGTTFSPDGQVLFVNIQHPGHTFAIYGPWDRT